MAATWAVVLNPGDSRVSFGQLLTFCRLPPRRLNLASGFLARPRLPRGRGFVAYREDRTPVAQHSCWFLFVLASGFWMLLKTLEI